MATPRIGDFYIQKSNQDFFLRELVAGVPAWVRKGNIRDEGSSGIIGISPVINQGYTMGVSLTRTQFLESVAMDLGFDVAVEVDRLRELQALNMGQGFVMAAAVQRIRQLAAAKDYGFEMEATVTSVAGNLEEIAASMALGFNQAAVLTRSRQLAAAMALGYLQSDPLTRQTLLTAAMAVGFTQATALTRSRQLAAAMALGYSQSDPLTRKTLLTSAMAFGYSQASPITHQSLVYKTAVGDNGTPFIHVYEGKTQGTTHSNPATLPVSGGTFGVSFSPDGTKLAVTSNATTNAIAIYDVTGGATTLITRFNAPTSARAVRCQWSPDSNYLVVALDATPFFAVYATSTWTKLANPATLPSLFSQAVAFNAQSNRVLVSEGSNLIRVYSLSGTTLTSLSTLATGFDPTQIEFSSDGTLMAVSENGTPGLETWTVTSSGTVFTKDTAFASSVTAAQGLAINNAKTRIAVGLVSSPFIAVYTLPGRTLNSNPASLPAGTGWDVCFSPDMDEIWLVGTNGGNLVSYDIATMTKSLRAISTGIPALSIAAIKN